MRWGPAAGWVGPRGIISRVPNAVRGFVYGPVVVLVEIAEAMRRGAIRHNGGFSRWARALLASGRFVAA